MYDSLFHCGFLYGFLDLAKVCVMSGGTEIGLPPPHVPRRRSSNPDLLPISVDI